MFNSLFKIVYFVQFVVMAGVRKFYTAKYRKITLKTDNKSLIDLIFLGLNGIGMLVPLVYVFSTVLDFADYLLPVWLGWIGAALFLLAIYLLWRSHADLGASWTPTLGIKEEHRLVTGGIFKIIRHPMYAAHIYWALAQILMLHNWIAGYSFIIFVIPQYLLRFKKEEQMMIQEFGDDYGQYMKKSGRIFPRLRG